MTQDGQAVTIGRLSRAQGYRGLRIGRPRLHDADLVQLNLVLNPKTPMAAAMGFLGRLHQHDVKKVAFSKNIPSALATAARRRLEQRK